MHTVRLAVLINQDDIDFGTCTLCRSAEKQETEQAAQASQLHCMCTLYEGQKPVVSTVTVKSMVKGLSAACSRFHSSKFCCLSRASCKSVTMPSICTAVSITVQHSWLTVETGEVTEFESDLAQPSCELCVSLLISAAFSKAASVKYKQAAQAVYKSRPCL